MITQEELKRLINYCPLSGRFSRDGRAKCGTRTYHGYTRIEINGKQYRASRLAWLYVYGEWPEIIDHINGKRSDDRIVNLRSVGYKENNRNAKMRSDNKSGFVGVTWERSSGKWKSHIRDKGKQITLGRYDSKSEAVKVRADAELRLSYHKNHGRLNAD